MEILNLGGAAESNNPAPKSRKKLRVILGIGALAAVTGIGSTLAANISLNGGGNVEFGQGVATTAACDDDITLTPVSEFSNTVEDPTFAMTAIQVSSIDLTPEGWNDDEGFWDPEFNRSTRTWSSGNEDRVGTYINSDTEITPTCEGKVLLLRAYTDDVDYEANTVDNDSASPLYLNGGHNSGVGFKIVYKSTSGTDGSYLYDYEAEDNFDVYPYVVTQNGTTDAVDVDYTVFYYSASALTINLDFSPNSYPPADSRWVDKLTIESADTLPANWTAGVGP